MARQLGLFSTGAPAIDRGFASIRRLELAHDAWVEHQAGWVSGHDSLFDTLERIVTWRSERRPMYDQVVDVPRLLGSCDEDLRPPLVETMRRVLCERYDEDFIDVTYALYRDGRDSVALHGDTTARDLPQALVATVSLGAPRRFLLKPADGGPSIGFELGGGDLYVMGGTCQRTWRHGIPKVRDAGPRMAIMFRPDFERSRTLARYSESATRRVK